MINVEDYKTLSHIVPKCTATNWSGFSNQPDDDGVEIVSDNIADAMYCTIWGTDHDTGVLCTETVTLTGTDAVSTTKTNWGNILSIFLGTKDGHNIVRATGTITIREASGNNAITTITATNFHAGMLNFYLPGKNVNILSASGNLYWSTFLPVATSTTGLEEVGKTSICVRVKDYLSLISDNTGASVQLAVLDN